MQSGTTSQHEYVDTHPQIAISGTQSSAQYTKFPVYRGVAGARLLNGI